MAKINGQQETSPELVIYMVSGGSGATARQTVRACLAQFPSEHVRLRQECSVVSTSEAQQIVAKAAVDAGIICHTLVDVAVRQALVQAALAAAVPCIDLLGPTLAILGERLSRSPLGKAGLLYELHREEFDRMDAVDFTMAHDDGQKMSDLDQADVVVVGLSRVSKSVTCFYLASRGVRAANVPLVAGLAVPQALLEVDSRKVFGLTMNASHLSRVRQARLNRIAANREVPNYADVRELNREIREVEALIARNHWRHIDASYKAIEEIASEIIDQLRESRDDLQLT